MSITSTKITKGILIREEDTLTPKEIEITPGGTPGTKTSLTSSQNTDKTLVLPNGNDTLVGNVTPAILTQKSIDAEQNTIVNISNTNIKNGANIAVDKLAALTVGKAVQTNVSTGAIEPSSVTNTELGYVSGVTSSIQTQITTNASNAASALSAHTGATSAHGVSGAVVGTTDTQTLTSKTIVAANNTITTAASGNLTSTNLNAALAELQTDIDTRDKIVDVNDKVNTSSINDRIYADGVVDNHQNTVDGIHGISGSVVGTFDTQVITNKDIDGGTASNTSRITLPKDTKTNLDGLTRKEGTIVFDTISKKPYYDNGTVLQLVGSGSGGGINYILNPDAETDLSGYSTYADVAGTKPVDGTGGTANTTFTRTIVSPLRGNASFLYTNNSGASRQGEGISFDFTIDTADKAKVLNFSFDYQLDSGTLVVGANSDLTMWIYDVTNSTLIEPSNNKLLSNSTTLVSKYSSTFQSSSNSTSYRLIIHKSTTNTSAFALRLDNITISPSEYVYGTPVTDWISYTPTFNGLGTVTLNEAFFRRVGDSIEIRGRLVLGTTTVAGAQIGLPTGYVVSDVAVLNQSIYGQVVNNSTSTNMTLLANQNLAYLSIGNVDLPGGLSLISGTSVGSSGNIVAWTSTAIPIKGLSSSVQVSSETDTRVVAARAVDSSGQSIPTGTITIVNFNTISFDSHAVITTGASWKYTAQVPGYYRVSSLINYVANSGGGSLLIYIYKNGTQISSNYTLWAATAAPYCANISDIVYLNSGDYVDIRTLQNAGANRPLTANSSYVSIDRISGPATIAASEKINASGSNNASTSIPTGTWTAVPTATLTINSHGALNTSGVFTAPQVDVYSVTANVCFTSNATGIRGVRIRKNGAATGFGSVIPTTTGGTITSVSIAGLVSCLSGDTITIECFQNSGGALTLSNDPDTFTTFTVTRK